MIWKIYFVLMTLFAIVSIGGIFTTSQKELSPTIINLLIFSIEIIGLYAYTFRKKLVTPKFWFGYFWFNVLLDMLFLSYVIFPHAPGLQLYSYLLVGNPGTITDALIGVIFDVPILYALFHLSKGQFYDSQQKPIVMHAPGVPKWGMVQTALWGYGLIITIIFALSSLLPTETKLRTMPTATDTIYAVMVVLPLLLFWLLILKQAKSYKWNWWKVTLVANGILYAAMMVGGSLFTSLADGESGGFDYIAIIQFLIIFIGLVVFGKEQFRKPEKKIAIKKLPKAEH